jgi:hypothetical protein
MQNMQTAHAGFQPYAQVFSFGGTAITPEEFVAPTILSVLALTTAKANG